MSAPQGTLEQNQGQTLGQNLYRGQIDSIGGDGRFQDNDDQGQTVHAQAVSVADHRQAIQMLLDWISREVASLDIVAIGHRVVHGGTRFHQPVLITTDVIDYLHSLIPLAPIHQPANLLGITELARLQPGLTQIACFDTAFHHTRPEVEQHFALPSRPELELVRRYGFHGLSYEYIASVLPDHLGKKTEGKIIVAHLGHGASMCALHQRRSVATTMTFTPLDGIPMGTRCAAIDPAVVLYLQHQGMTLQAGSDLLYFQSGLLGVSGKSADMADLLEHKTPQTEQAIEQFVHNSVRAIGSLAAVLEGLDALIFTGGIGEHSATIREAICTRCQWPGLELDMDANHHGHAQISQTDSPVQAWVISTDEERMIEGADPQTVHQAMAATLDQVMDDIQSIQTNARNGGKFTLPRWPMIILRTPKGWTCPKEIDGLKLEDTWRAHLLNQSVEFPRPDTNTAVIFSEPEIGIAGLTEQQAQQDGGEVAVARYDFSQDARAQIDGCDAGILKIVYTTDTHAIVGVHALVKGAGDLIGEAAVLVRAAMPIQAIAAAIHPYPTLTESFALAVRQAMAKAGMPVDPTKKGQQ